MMLKEFYYRDQNGKCVARVIAPDILAADNIMASHGKKKITTVAIGGRLIFYRRDSKKPHVVQRDKYGNALEYAYFMDEDDRAVYDQNLIADSLSVALTKYDHVVKKYRYDLDMVILWKTAMGHAIVKNLNESHIEPSGSYTFF